MRHVAILAVAIQFGGRAVILEAELANVQLRHLERLRIGGVVPAVDIVTAQLNRLDSLDLLSTQDEITTLVSSPCSFSSSVGSAFVFCLSHHSASITFSTKGLSTSRSRFRFFLFSVEIRDPGTQPSMRLSSVHNAHGTDNTIDIVNIVLELPAPIRVRPFPNLLHNTTV